MRSINQNKRDNPKRPWISSVEAALRKTGGNCLRLLEIGKDGREMDLRILLLRRAMLVFKISRSNVRGVTNFFFNGNYGDFNFNFSIVFDISTETEYFEVFLKLNSPSLY